MAARDKRLRLQLAAIEDLKQLLQNEIVSLEKKIDTQNRQVDLSRQELKGIGNLKDQGLVVNARVLSIEQTIAELEGKVLDMETAALRAKQDIAKATQDATSLQNDHDAEVAQERQQAEADIEETRPEDRDAHGPDDRGAGKVPGGGAKCAPRRRSATPSCGRQAARQPRWRPTRTRRFFPATSSRSPSSVAPAD